MKKKFIGDKKSERKKKALRNGWCQHTDMWGKTQEMYVWRNSDITEFNLTVTKGE